MRRFFTLCALMVWGCDDGGGGGGNADPIDAAAPADTAIVLDAPEPVFDAGPPDADLPDGRVADAQPAIPSDAHAPADPAPGVDVPGEHGGAGCPDSAETVFTVNAGAATTFTFSGTVTGNAGDGVFYVRGPAGEEVSGAIETNGAGAYQKTVPLFCGASLVKLVWQNATCPLVVVYAVDRSPCVADDIVLTLQWDAIGDDWELHLVKPGGRINDDATDCTWTSCIDISPDWGVFGDPADDPHKDIDDVDGFGPENVTLTGPEAGTYTVLVEHWGTGDPLSDGSLTLNVMGQVMVIDRTDLVPQHVWTAATIDWPSGTVTPLQNDYDCSGNWSGGCRDQLP